MYCEMQGDSRGGQSEWHSPVTPMIEGSILIKQTEEKPHADGLHPEHNEQQPHRGQQELTHHPCI